MYFNCTRTHMIHHSDMKVSANHVQLSQPQSQDVFVHDLCMQTDSRYQVIPLTVIFVTSVIVQSTPLWAHLLDETHTILVRPHSTAEDRVTNQSYDSKGIPYDNILLGPYIICTRAQVVSTGRQLALCGHVRDIPYEFLRSNRSPK